MAEAGGDLWVHLVLPLPPIKQGYPEQVAQHHLQATFGGPFHNAGIWGKAPENRVSQVQARVFWHRDGTWTGVAICLEQLSNPYLC